MCLRRAKKIEANRDIKCYKIVLKKDPVKGRKLFSSPYYSYTWIMGHTEALFEPIEVHENLNGLVVNGGVFHAFKHFDDARYYASYLFSDGLSHPVIVECTIPASARAVYEGYTETCLIPAFFPSYASTEMSVNGVVWEC